MKIRRGDTVWVRRGKDRGKTGRVLAVLPREGRLLVEGMNIVKKHVRPKRAGEKGQRVTVASPLNIAAVSLVCPNCKKSTRVGKQRGGEGVWERVCKKCHETIPFKK
ncbi:MAG: 50S ribosomal protein L24 [Candidatus Andersenbacteria bacterium]